MSSPRLDRAAPHLMLSRFCALTRMMLRWGRRWCTWATIASPTPLRSSTSTPKCPGFSTLFFRCVCMCMCGCCCGCNKHAPRTYVRWNSFTVSYHCRTAWEPHDAICHGSTPKEFILRAAPTCEGDDPRRLAIFLPVRFLYDRLPCRVQMGSLTTSAAFDSFSLLLCSLQAIDYLSDLDKGSDPVLLGYIKTRWGSVEYAQRYILRNFFRFG